MILHNQTVRMHQNGAFSEEANSVMSNLITEFYNTDRKSTFQAAAECQQNRVRACNEILADWQSEAERMVLAEVENTDYQLHIQQMRDLVDYLRAAHGPTK